MQQVQQVARVSASWGMDPRGQSPEHTDQSCPGAGAKGSQHQAPSVIQEAGSEVLLISGSIAEVYY